MVPVSLVVSIQGHPEIQISSFLCLQTQYIVTTILRPYWFSGLVSNEPPPRVFCNVTPPPFFTFPKQFFRSVVVCRLTFINQSLILYLPISNPLFTDLQSFIYRYPILHLPISDPLFTDLQSFIYQSPILYLPISNPLFTDLQSFIYRSPILYLPISNPLFTDLQSFVYRSPILYLQISNPLFTDLQSLNSWINTVECVECVMHVMKPNLYISLLPPLIFPPTWSLII